MTEFLRNSDAFIWTIENDPRLRSTIVTLALVDRAHETALSPASTRYLRLRSETKSKARLLSGARFEDLPEGRYPRLMTVGQTGLLAPSKVTASSLRADRRSSPALIIAALARGPRAKSLQAWRRNAEVVSALGEQMALTN